MTRILYAVHFNPCVVCITYSGNSLRNSNLHVDYFTSSSTVSCVEAHSCFLKVLLSLLLCACPRSHASSLERVEQERRKHPISLSTTSWDSGRRSHAVWRTRSFRWTHWWKPLAMLGPSSMGTHQDLESTWSCTSHHQDTYKEVVTAQGWCIFRGSAVNARVSVYVCAVRVLFVNFNCEPTP